MTCLCLLFLCFQGVACEFGQGPLCQFVMLLLGFVSRSAVISGKIPMG